jgi:hypothetical protein
VPAPANRKRWPFYWLAIYLIGTFLWRSFIPAHEYPMRPAQVMTMAFDLMCIVGLIGLKIWLFQGRQPKGAVGTMSSLLFGIALLAGLGLFAIRLSGDPVGGPGTLTTNSVPGSKVNDRNA